MIPVKAIRLGLDGLTEAHNVDDYAAADRLVREIAARLGAHELLPVHARVLFGDLFVWSTAMTIGRAEASGDHVVQRAIQADWEFNAGVQPSWWPKQIEAERMWGVHFREDRANGRAELARMRLGAYDLAPLELTQLPPPPRVRE